MDLAIKTTNLVKKFGSNTVIPFILFSITEIISPTVKDTFSLELLFSTLKRIFISILGVSGIGIVSMRI